MPYYKRKFDYSAPNVVRAPTKKRAVNTTGYGTVGGAISALKTMARNMGVPPSVSNNLRTSGNISRFQPGSGDELKFFDVMTNGGTFQMIKSGSDVFYDSSPSPKSLCTGIARNTGPSDRIGNLITVKSLNFKATVILGLSNNPSNWSGSYKIFIVLDKQANGTTPDVKQIWAPGTSVGTDASINSNINITNSSRFQILKLFKGSINANGFGFHNTVSNQFGRFDAQKLINFSMKLNIPIKYASDNSTGALSGITDNNLWVYAFSDDAGSGQINLINPIVRLRFTDK